MTTLTVAIADKVIIKDGEALFFEGNIAETAFDAVVTAQGHTNANAIQWDGTTGTVEDIDLTKDHALPTQDQINAYIAAFDTEVERRKQKKKTDFLAQDAVQMAKGERNFRLYETDKEALSDRTMSAAMTTYRQALRDLPDHATDWNPALSWDDDTWTGSLTGVTWPTKP